MIDQHDPYYDSLTDAQLFDLVNNSPGLSGEAQAELIRRSYVFADDGKVYRPDERAS